MTDRKEFITDEMLDYLDALRESGKTNMWAAGLYVESEFPGLTLSESSQVVGYWMETFPREVKA